MHHLSHMIWFKSHESYDMSPISSLITVLHMICIIQYVDFRCIRGKG